MGRVRAKSSVRSTVAAIELLLQLGATSIVSACNSVSASLAVSLFDTLSLAPDRLIEMVGPTATHFKGSPARILLAATPATISSEIYQHAFLMLGKRIDTLAIADLAGAIEAGENIEKIEGIIKDAFASVKREDYDVLILGCTHYPLVLSSFTRVLGAGIEIYDPAEAVGERVKQQLWPREVAEGKMRFLISRDSDSFRARVAEFFPESEASIEVLD